MVTVFLLNLIDLTFTLNKEALYMKGVEQGRSYWNRADSYCTLVSLKWITVHHAFLIIDNKILSLIMYL